MKEVEIEGGKIHVTSTVDAVGLFCPIPIVKLKLELTKLTSGQVVEVMADDPGFEQDVINWCKDANHRLLSLTKNDENISVAFVEKA